MRVICLLIRKLFKSSFAIRLASLSLFYVLLISKVILTCQVIVCVLVSAFFKCHFISARRTKPVKAVFISLLPLVSFIGHYSKCKSKSKYANKHEYTWVLHHYDVSFARKSFVSFSL